METQERVLIAPPLSSSYMMMELRSNNSVIESTLMPNGACAATDLAYNANLVHGAAGAPAAVDVYQAILMGENYYGLAVALPVELRDNGVDDFGRNHAVAWYSIFGAAVLNAENAVIIESV